MRSGSSDDFGSAGAWSLLVELRSRAADVIPGGLGSDERVRFDSNTRITIDGPERYAVHDAAQDATQRRATDATEREAPAAVSSELSQFVFTGDPVELASDGDLSVSR